ncbi:MAG: hypothetical protein AMJ88_13490 [Anaerolineae bacterium SM23_ 63]|nr:MAG: hypothetical protein AMJ88_13490 [Anaerolineae bacterium SM23_ 63]
MYTLFDLLFPLALPFMTFADGGGGETDEESGTDSDKEENGDGEDSEDEEMSEESEESAEDLESLKEELKRTRNALRSANKEAKERRLRLKKLEEEETKRKQAEMSELEIAKEELEKASKERDRLRESRTELIIRHAIELGATKLGFVDPGDAFTLMDMKEIEIDDETGKVEGIDKALKALAKAKPYLLGQDQEGGHGTPLSIRGKKSQIKKDALPNRSMAQL